MCVIIYKSDKVKLTKEILQNAVETNPDGLGVTVLKPSGWKVKKYLAPTNKNLESVLKWIRPTDQAVLHARIATSGLINRSNCHPFVSDSYLFFHNGVLSNLNGIHDTLSDTALLFKLLNSFSVNEAVTLLDNISQNTWSKFILIDKKSNKIYMLGNFHNHKGLECSNLNFTAAYKQQQAAIQARLATPNNKQNFYYYTDPQPKNSVASQCSHGWGLADATDTSQSSVIDLVDPIDVNEDPYIDYVESYKNLK
jgi:predicted glutamine amidotransferase